RAVAHGCTGKGNDQVRFDLTFQTLDHNLQIIAPVREWKMTRDEEIKFAAKHGIPVEATQESPYSLDLNLWGRSCEAGVLEDPWDEPPAEAYGWTVDPAKAPDAPECVTIDFEQGRPVARDGVQTDAVPLIDKLDRLGGKHVVSGQARVKLFKGKATVVGRQSEHSLYSKKLATYDTADSFDHDAAKGFIRLWGLGQQTQAQRQLLKGGRGFELPGLLTHKE